MKTKFTLYLKENKIDVQLPVPGEQGVYNALAAASVGHTLGVSLSEIKNGLENYIKPEHRMIVIKLDSGALIVDDSYNNNPQAAKEALLTFKEIAGNNKMVVVFGDMLELGIHAKDYHRQLGEYISTLGMDYLIGVGQLSKYTVNAVSGRLERNNVFWVSNQNQVDPLIKPLLKKGTAVLIKGSRSIELDKLVSRLS